MAENKTNFELVVELIKALIWPIIITVLLVSNCKSVNDSFNNVPDLMKKISHLKAGELEADFKESEENLQKADTTTRKIAKDVTPTDDLTEDAKVIQTIIPQNGSWVYLGQKINNNWSTNNFSILEEPKEGMHVIASKAVYKRDYYPIQEDEDKWKLGKIIGVVEPGQSVQFVQIKIVEGENYWAFVTLV